MLFLLSLCLSFEAVFVPTLKLDEAFLIEFVLDAVGSDIAFVVLRFSVCTYDKYTEEKESSISERILFLVKLFLPPKILYYLLIIICI